MSLRPVVWTVMESARRQKPGRGQLSLGLVHVPPHQRDGHQVAGYDRHQQVVPDVAPDPDVAPVERVPTASVDYVRVLRAQGRAGLANAVEKALDRYDWPTAYATFLGRSAERTMRDGRSPPAQAVRIAANDLRDRLEDPVIHTDADRYGLGPMDYASIREAIDTWEDSHRAAEAEHLHLVIAAGPLAGRVYEHTPATTALMTNADPRGTVAVSPEAMLAAQLSQTAILTHNHPYGSCLSDQDVILAVNLNAAEIRATTPDGAWVVTRPRDGWPDVGKVSAALLSAQIAMRQKDRVNHGTEEERRAARREEWAGALPGILSDLGITLEFRRVGGRRGALRKAVDPGGRGLGGRLIVWLRKAVEQLGMFGQVKAHDRRTEDGKTVHVKQHRRKRGPLTDEQWSTLRRKKELRQEFTPEEQELHDAHIKYVRAADLSQRGAWARLRRDGIDHHGANGRALWRTWSSHGIDGRADWEHLYAMHPDGQVRVRITGEVATLQTRVDGLADEWVDHGTVPRTSSVRVEGDLLARDQRRRFGPMSELRAKQAREEQEATDPKRPTRWGYASDSRWAPTWTRARDQLRSWFGEIRAKKNIREIQPGVLRVDVEVQRMSDGAVVGRGAWVDETGREPDGTAALWQLPHGAQFTLPEGLDREPRHDGKPRTFRLDWTAFDRPAVATSASQVMVRPTAYGTGQHLDPTILVTRTDDDDIRKELAATMALQHAVQQAVDRKHGFGEDLPAIAWPPAPARGDTYKEAEFKAVVGMKLDRSPEVEALKADVLDWQRKMRREVGDHAFDGVANFSGDEVVPNVWAEVGNWRERIWHDADQKMWDGSTRDAMPMTPAAVSEHWDKFWAPHAAAVRAFLDKASDPALYDRRTTPEYILEHLMGDEMGPGRDYRSEGLAKVLLERRGHHFGRRSKLPEFYELRGPHAWAKYTEARRAQKGGGEVLQLTSPEGDVHSAKSADAVEYHQRLKDAIRDLGENPHHKLVEKGGHGDTWHYLDPFGNRLWHADTRREARQKAHDNMVRMVAEAERNAGSAAIASTG